MDISSPRVIETRGEALAYHIRDIHTQQEALPVRLLSLDDGLMIVGLDLPRHESGSFERVFRHARTDPLAARRLDIGERLAQNIGRGGTLVQFTVGLKLKGKTDHIVVDAEDALIAALRVKTEHPEAAITYVRQQNRRGDARHPSHALVENNH